MKGLSTGRPDLDEKIQEWLLIDKNTATCSELTTLVQNQEVDELEDILTKRMAFGTAGLRARMGPGYAQMNDVTIIQTSQGFGKYLLQSNEGLAKEKGVVVGFDARHNSSRFVNRLESIFKIIQLII